jgi:hypothetical protein
MKKETYKKSNGSFARQKKICCFCNFMFKFYRSQLRKLEKLLLRRGCFYSFHFLFHCANTDMPFTHRDKCDFGLNHQRTVNKIRIPTSPRHTASARIIILPFILCDSSAPSCAPAITPILRPTTMRKMCGSL